MNSIVSWSGGKDSCLAFLKAQKAGHKVKAILTAMNENGTFSKSNGVPIKIIEKQSEALRLPIIKFNTSWESYGKDLLEALIHAKDKFSVKYCIFGDIDIQNHRDFEERISVQANLKAVLPLWGMHRVFVARDIISFGIKSKISVIRENLPDEILGAEFDYNLLEKLERLKIDICGENGEFHTVVYDTPSFTRHKFFLKRKKNHTLDRAKLIEFSAIMTRKCYRLRKTCTISH